MSAAYNTIAFKTDQCDGCNACMTACAEVKSGGSDLRNARIQIVPDMAGRFELAMCRQCAEMARRRGSVELREGEGKFQAGLSSRRNVGRVARADNHLHGNVATGAVTEGAGCRVATVTARD